MNSEIYYFYYRWIRRKNEEKTLKEKTTHKKEIKRIKKCKRKRKEKTLKEKNEKRNKENFSKIDDKK